LTYTATPSATSRLYVDDVKFFAPTMAVVDAGKAKANLVKNTIVSNELIFGATGKISIVNMNGQVVKTAEVSENSRLDVSGLTKGTYVVTGIVNEQAVSQKIIKK
jgi:fructose-1,6-bisphosphatase/inositol monophosphatase family enzyme